MVGTRDGRADRGPCAPPVSHARIWLAGIGLLLYILLVLTATMWPTPLDRGYESSIARFLDVLHRNGVPEWFGYRKFEFTANIAMFLPLGFLLVLVLRRRVMWLALLIVPLSSITIELLQALLLAERFASPLDVLANTLGGIIGGGAGALVRAGVNARDRKVIARAVWLDRADRSGASW